MLSDPPAQTPAEQAALALPPWPRPLTEEAARDAAIAFATPARDAEGRPREDSWKKRLEKELARRVGTAHALAVNSGTSALDLAVAYAAERRPGTVLASVYGHPSSVKEAARRGRLGLIDVDEDTLCLSPAALKAAAARGPVAAVVVTHTAGHPGRIDALAAICAELGALLIEDCAHAHGAASETGPVGSLGDAGCFSFHWAKTVPAGEGGALTTSDAGLFSSAHKEHDIGHDPGALPYDYAGTGGNWRMSEPAAAVAFHRLGDLEEDLLRKERAVYRLRAALPEGGPVRFQAPLEGKARHGYHFLPLLTAADAPRHSAMKLLLELKKRGLPAGLGWPQPLSDIVPSSFVEAPTGLGLPGRTVWVDQRVLLSAAALALLEDALHAAQRRLS